LSIFIRDLTPVSKDHVYGSLLQIFLTGWAIAALFGSAFACAVPRAWDYRNGQCFDLVSLRDLGHGILILIALQESWKYYFYASNIVTDALIIIQALVLISRIQASLKKKAIFASIFLTRVL
jgi:hypothetical protein